MLKMLFTPIKVGQMELKNRMVMPAMYFLNSVEGMVLPSHTDFFVERAKGGVSLITIGGCTIDETSGPVHMLSVRDDKFIPGLSGLAKAVQGHGAKIAAPELPNKARSGRLDEIRYCIACNQGCFNPLSEEKPQTCLVNAQAGAEGKRIIHPAFRKKKVMVVGGGPAGMEAARVAALRGHEVCLYEKNETLGGQIPLAAAPPGRKEFLTFGRYLETQMKKLRVAVHTGVEATLQQVERESPDAVVLATGAEPLVPHIKGGDRPEVVTAWDVLLGKVDPGREVVIIGGGATGLETALLLARKGTLDADTLYFLMFNQAESQENIQALLYRGLKKITVLEMLNKVGQDIGVTTRWTVIQDLSRLGVRLMTEALAEEIADQGVLIDREGREEWIPADTVVLATGTKPVDFLYEQIKDRVKEIHLIGDAKTPRKALEAVAEGLEAGRTI